MPPQALLKQALPFLAPSEASDSADRGRWVGIDRRDPGSRGDGQMPSCEEERTWLL